MRSNWTPAKDYRLTETQVAEGKINDSRGIELVNIGLTHPFYVVRVWDRDNGTCEQAGYSNYLAAVAKYATIVLRLSLYHSVPDAHHLIDFLTGRDGRWALIAYDQAADRFTVTGEKCTCGCRA